MDIISHTLTGVAVGTVIASVDGSILNKAKIILTGGFGGALPDFDALSLWSKFDKTIGKFLFLEHSGKEIYFGKFWYSHHGGFHSILAPLLLILGSFFLSSFLKKDTQFLKRLESNKWYYIAFFFGFFCHLLEDMPTPACVWGGVNMFFPSKAYVGGFGQIWWWNNYDLVLIIVSVILINLIINFLSILTMKMKQISIGVCFFIGLISFIYQINTRPFDFAYDGHNVNYYQYEQKSKEIQRDILGDKLFNVMYKLDSKIPLNF